MYFSYFCTNHINICIVLTTICIDHTTICQNTLLNVSVICSVLFQQLPNTHFPLNNRHNSLHTIYISVVQQLMILDASSLLSISITFITYLKGIVYLNEVGTLFQLLSLLKIHVRQSLTCVKAIGGKSSYPI